MSVKKELPLFLTKAKKQAHSLNAEYKVNEYGAKEFLFKEGDFIYWNKKMGTNPFGGQEILFYQQKPIWILNYWGYFQDKKRQKEVEAFLEKVLFRVSEEMPIRGPEKIQELIRGEIWSYEIIGKPQIEKFKISEFIKINNETVYEGYIHGGIIK